MQLGFGEIRLNTHFPVQRCEGSSCSTLSPELEGRLDGRPVIGANGTGHAWKHLGSLTSADLAHNELQESRTPSRFHCGLNCLCPCFSFFSQARVQLKSRRLLGDLYGSLSRPRSSDSSPSPCSVSRLPLGRVSVRSPAPWHAGRTWRRCGRRRAAEARGHPTHTLLPRLGQRRPVAFWTLVLTSLKDPIFGDAITSLSNCIAGHSISEAAWERVFLG